MKLKNWVQILAGKFFVDFAIISLGMAWIQFSLKIWINSMYLFNFSATPRMGREGNLWAE